MIDSRIRKEHITRYGLTEDVENYLRVLEGLRPIPDSEIGEDHHCLHKSGWPEYKNLKTNPWNRLRCHRALHLALTHFQAQFEERLRHAVLMMKGQTAEAQLKACRLGGKAMHKSHPNTAKENGKLQGKKNIESGHLRRVPSQPE